MTIGFLRKITASTLESTIEHVENSVEEREQLLVIQAREKMGDVLGKTDQALDLAQKATSRFSCFESLTQGLKNTSVRIQREKEENDKEIGQAKEDRAWATLGKHLHGSLAQLKATTGATVVVAGTSESLPLNQLSQNTFTCLSWLNCNDKEIGQAKEDRAWATLGKHLHGSLAQLKATTGATVVIAETSESLPLNQLPQNTFTCLSWLNCCDCTCDCERVPTPSVPTLGLDQADIELTYRDVEVPRVTLPKAITKVVREKVEEAVISSVEKRVMKPFTDKEEELDRIVETNFGKKGTESLEAIKTILDHRTTDIRRKTSEQWGKVKTSFRRFTERAG